MEIRQVTILGTGTMGRGIAYLAALAGYDTVMFDLEQSLHRELLHCEGTKCGAHDHRATEILVAQVAGLSHARA